MAIQLGNKPAIANAIRGPASATTSLALMP
jgi:hypothetical protein